jgi:RNA polymerase sigma-70 factor (ECF subfamily)
MGKYLELELFSDQLPSLQGYALTLTRNMDAADDLVQDSMLKGIANIATFTPGTNLRRWLFTIMHNVFCDQYRQQRRRGQQVPLVDWQDHIPQSERQSEAIELREVAAAFGRLSAEQQRLIAMVGVEGESHQYAAAHFGVAVGTIKSRLSRTRAQLRESQIGIAKQGISIPQPDL